MTHYNRKPRTFGKKYFPPLSLFFVLLFVHVLPVEVTCATANTQTSQQADAAQTTDADSLSLNASSAILLEASTGTVLYEKDADVEKAPASVTKVMTLLLIFDALEHKQISLKDTVTVSSYAASMGGSQVFLEAGETQTVDTMIKCIAVSSANDACVAMAEYIAGSEEAFVQKMNEKAKQLGMEHTHFVNCNGLDTDGHYTTARDIAKMSLELTSKHPDIFYYTTIWMDHITHVTARGSSEFGLSNTNKLLKQYEGATGLKTGSTDKAGFCLSATATRNHISLIAVVMGCDSSAKRIKSASSLLDYGFLVCHIYRDSTPAPLPCVPVSGGTKTSVACHYEKEFSCVTAKELDSSVIEKKVELPPSVDAPLKKNQKIGQIIYSYAGSELGRLDILSSEDMAKAKFTDRFVQLCKKL